MNRLKAFLNHGNRGFLGQQLRPQLRRSARRRPFMGYLAARGGLFLVETVQRGRDDLLPVAFEERSQASDQLRQVLPDCPFIRLPRGAFEAFAEILSIGRVLRKDVLSP